jgi:Skp family chaperone for outer membrane proteins
MSAEKQETPPSPESVPPVPPRRRWLPIMLAAAIFVSGCIVGAGTTILVIRNKVMHGIQHPEEAPARITAALTHRFKLTPDQAEKVETILKARQAELQKIRSETQPKVEAELDRAEAEIAQVLNEQQRDKLHERFQKLRESWLPERPEPVTSNQ